MNEKKKSLVSGIRGFGFVVLLVIVGVGIGLTYLGRGMCGSDLQAEITSPDGELKAVVFQYDCGATTPFSTQISLLRADQELKNKPGNVFTATTDHGATPAASWGGPEVEVVWLDDATLLIVYDDRAWTGKREGKVKGINITYETKRGDFHLAGMTATVPAPR